MANIPADLRYTKEHESVKQTGADAIVQIGITDYAQGELGDVVFVDLPKVGAVFARGDVFGTIEAVKAVSELYAPLAGTVTEVNKALEGDPALVNRDPDRPAGRRDDHRHSGAGPVLRRTRSHRACHAHRRRPGVRLRSGQACARVPGWSS